MIVSFTILFFILIVFGSYVAIKYKNSRNKKLFLKTGSYKTFVWSVLLLLSGGFLVYLVIPQNGTHSNLTIFHSETVMEALTKTKDPTYYLFRALSIFTEMNIAGFLFASLILAIWMYYVRSIDFFNQEKATRTALCLGLSMFLTAFLTIPFSALIKDVFQIEFSENTFYNLFIFSFLGIGVVEELVKLIPVLVIFSFTDEIEEPIDLIYYASVSALGFAFVENLIYFKNISGNIIIGRSLTATVGHMIDASIIAYGMVLYKFKFREKKPQYILYYFLLGSLSHTLYDYFLFENLFLFFVACFIFLVQVWAIMINNCLNNSKFFSYQIIYKNNEVKYKLSLFVITLILLNFLKDGILVGKHLAFENFVNTSAWSSLVIVFFSSSISSFDLYRGYWRPIKFQLNKPSTEGYASKNRSGTLIGDFFSANTITPQNHVGKSIKLHSPIFNQQLSEVFRIGKGKIEGRIKLFSDKKKVDNDWFKVKLETTIFINENFESNYILIKIRNKYASLVHDEHIECWMKLIPRNIELSKISWHSSYKSFGYIMINGEDYQYS